MKYKRAWTVIVMFGAIGASLALADVSPNGAPPAGAPPAGGPGGMQGPWKQKLGLSDEQAQKLQAALQAHRTAMQNLRQQRRQGLQTLRSQVQANAGDSDLQATLAQLVSVEKSIQAENDQLNRTLSGFLTPRQRAQMLLGLMGRILRQGPGMQGPLHQGEPGASAPATGGDEGEPDTGAQ